MWNCIKNIITVFVTLGVFVAGIVCFTPCWTFYEMKQALDRNDADRFSKYIDYPAVRKSIRDNLRSMMQDEVNAGEDNSFVIGVENFCTSLTLTIPHLFINKITPKNVKNFIKKQENRVSNIESIFATYDFYPSYNNINQFVLTVYEKGFTCKIGELIFQKVDILTWRLVGVRFSY